MNISRRLLYPALGGNKSKGRLLLCGGLSVIQVKAFSKGTNDKEVKSKEMIPFYALGVSIGSQLGPRLRSVINETERDAFLAGFSDWFSNKIPSEEEDRLLQENGEKINHTLATRFAELKEEETPFDAIISAYLKLNPTAIQTKSGLVFHELSPGTGPHPTVDSKIVVHYHGTLPQLQDKVFDSSVQRKQPLEFSLGQVIAGWQEGLQLMRPGGVAVLLIPPDLGYGVHGAPPTIPPNALLRFEVELIKIL